MSYEEFLLYIFLSFQKIPTEQINHINNIPWSQICYEQEGVRKFGAMFIAGMGWPLKDGSEPEEVRAPDYDDWHLNGDIMVLHPITQHRHELSSMGIRVDCQAMRRQLEATGKTHLSSLPYHAAVLEDRLPLSIGGGLGISRLMMLLLQKGHIGEVQAGIWHPEHIKEALAHNFDLVPTNMHNNL